MFYIYTQHWGEFSENILQEGGLPIIQKFDTRFLTLNGIPYVLLQFWIPYYDLMFRTKTKKASTVRCKRLYCTSLNWKFLKL